MTLLAPPPPPPPPPHSRLSSIEVEKALRVLDGAILVLCAVGGVQSQTQTVFRQLERWHVPRLLFVNKLDRSGADPDSVIEQFRKTFPTTNPIQIQVPLGLENEHVGVVDLIRMKTVRFDGDSGERVVTSDADVPASAAEAREHMLYAIADVDEDFGERFFADPDSITEAHIVAALRKATINHRAVPVLMGSAVKNKGIQPLLDAVCDLLPSPVEVVNNDSAGEPLDPRNTSPSALVGLAFKLEETRFGQLTHFRIYQGQWGVCVCGV